MRLPKVAIIVLNYNGRQFLNNCFSSLKKLNYPNFEVTMVDDCSTDDSVAFVAKKFPWVKILQNAKNMGACVSFNRAVKRTTAELIVKIDNDVKVDRNWLREMVETIGSDPEVGVVGSRILNYDGKSDQEFGSSMDRVGYFMSYLGLEGGIRKLPKVRKVFYVSGCSMLFKKKVFEAAGMFDEKFYIYKDDLDLCWRMKLLGYKTVTNLESVICHMSGVTQGGGSKGEGTKIYHTTARKRFFGERNTLRMLLKNYSAGNLLKVLPVYFLIIFGESIFFVLMGQFKLPLVYFRAFWWNILNLQDTLKERREIQKKRKVPDSIIMGEMAKGSLRWEMFKIVRVPKID
jgi:GT2 family glycosyltransferase